MLRNKNKKEFYFFVKAIVEKLLYECCTASKPQFVQKFQYNLYLFDQPHKNRPIQKTRFCCGLCIFRFVG